MPDGGIPIGWVNKNGNTAIHEAAIFNQCVDIIRVLHDQGCSVHARGLCSRTPLLLVAAENANPQILELLVKRFAELQSVDEDESSAIHLAASSNNNRKVVQYLLDLGADINAA